MTGGGPAARYLVALALALLFSWSRPALAQVEVTMRVSAREVSVGEVLQVQLDALGSGDAVPEDPEIQVPAGFDVRGPSIGSRQQVSISNFNMITQRGISATWLLTPKRPGLYSIGPASVRVGGQLHRAEPAQVRVLPEGKKPRRRLSQRRRNPFDFDPFDQSDSFDDIFERLRRSAAPRQPEAPDGLVVARPPDTLAFVRARLDRNRAVVGQQVTLSIYAYGGQGMFQEAGGSREPTHSAFLARRLVEDGGRQPVYQYEAAGQRWLVVKVREIALFPLRAGRLEVGPLEFGFLGRRYGMRSGEGLRRTTRPLFVDVSEPPARGRPAGYSGEVGRFRLEAKVEPREIAAGGAISVLATLSGTGQLPGRLKLPEQAGVEWVEPTIRDDVSVSGGRVGGERTFSYVVRLLKPGTLDLGSLTLPYYDPASGRYRTARARLGEVVVTPAPASASGAASDDDSEASGGAPRLGPLYPFRARLGSQSERSYLADSRAFWSLVALLPVLSLCLLFGRSSYQRLLRRLRRSRESRAMHASQALRDARVARERGQPADVAGAVERALYHAIEWATALRARAVLRSDLAASLSDAGLAEDLCAQILSVIDRSGAVRYGGTEGSDVDGLLGDAQAIVRRLLRLPEATPRAASAGSRLEASP